MSGRWLRGGLVAALVSGAISTAPAASAAGAGLPASWVGIDSRTPFAAVTTGDPRVGAWRDGDGKHHIGKAYFTFNVARFAGTSVQGATFAVTEKSAADCAVPRALSASWVTPDGPVTWAEQPAERLPLPGPSTTTGCVGRIRWDASAALEQAVAEGRSTLTLAVASTSEGDIAYGRALLPDGWLSVDYNTTPDVPTRVSLISGAHPFACEGTPLLTGRGSLRMNAWVSDPDGDWISARFAFWPVADPSARVETTSTSAYGGPVTSDIQAAAITDGADYAFAVRAEDAHSASAWTAPCVFRADLTAPDRPTVTSPVYNGGREYPGDGGVGIAGDFTFTSAPDVVAFEYWGTGLPHGSIAAVNGTATAPITPSRDGPMYISVTAIDAAGNRSDPTYYDFWVRDTRPVIDSPRGVYGEPFTVTITATQEGATTLHYTVDGAESTVPLADGIATVTLTIPAPPGPILRAWTTTADGTASQVAVLDYAGPIEET